MSTTDKPKLSASLNIDPRLHQMQDSNERSTNDDDESKAALNHLYQREREQEYPPDVEALLKQLPPNALPPVSAPGLISHHLVKRRTMTCDGGT